MNTTHSTTNSRTYHAAAGRGPHHLMLGVVTMSRLLGGKDTDDQLELAGARRQVKRLPAVPRTASGGASMARGRTSGCDHREPPATGEGRRYR